MTYTESEKKNKHKNIQIKGTRGACGGDSCSLGGQAVGTMGWHLTALFPWPKKHLGLLLDKTTQAKSKGL